ncbi:putative ER lumen protein retaining receptor [Medicago truncatula]|uniref:ER lumen protein retaining receptor-like protein n=1 Tax=Medicago truncatula TaxID=3880 RepID=A0A072TLL5_MEDTR|nr:ER lumen protein-retaining receptor A [Medicago truncatula]KEH18126.1 ER lumen protein retaining receptor-like protein [Medicago truncatula]RHN39018.1 putative ER lumen protein retaining receptor [Medicago truncatula]
MGSKRDSPVNVMFGWLRKRSMKVKIFLGILLAFCAIVVLKHTIREPNFFFKASETVHIIGLIVLIYKLYVHKSCSGISLKSQELTALFLATRLVGRAYIMANLHSVLDLILLLSTLLVIWMIRFKLKSSYIKEFDNMWLSLLVAFCAILAIIIHPLFTHHSWIARVFWVFPTYLETISILPQLRYMQNAKIVETFTGYYVFALGVSRFLSLAFWIIHTYDTRGKYLFFFGHGYFWMLSLFLSEIIQSFILADFCYYYIKSFMQGKLLRKMPV